MGLSLAQCPQSDPMGTTSDSMGALYDLVGTIKGASSTPPLVRWGSLLTFFDRVDPLRVTRPRLVGPIPIL